MYQWYRAEDTNGTNEVAIQGANQLNYTLLRPDRANFIRFSVTPVAQTGKLLQGNKVYSSYTEEIAYSTGIDDVLKKELKLYPNPVHELLYIENLKMVKRLSLYDLSGKIVLSVNTPNASATLNLRGLNSGIYLLNFEMEDGSKLTRKIVKQ